ncbi:MAG: cyclic pyranopterin monophosphate synthase MoaC [Alphaproteobacteria bacterium]
MSKLTHLSETGEARMVDVGTKSPSARKAIAQGHIKMKAETFKLVRDGNGPKGDVLGPARIAGIMAAKRTAELIPLCHPLPLDFVGVDFALDEAKSEIIATAEARTSGKTGVEMEALTAVSVALLTIYDMAKAVDRAMEIGGIRLLEKTGGVRGDYHVGEKR